MHGLNIIKISYDDTILGHISFIAQGMMMMMMISNVRADTQPESSSTEVKVHLCSSAISSTFPGTMNTSHTW